MHCPHCGSENPDNLKYCIECGEPLKAFTKKAKGEADADASNLGKTEKFGRVVVTDEELESAKKGAAGAAAAEAVEEATKVDTTSIGDAKLSRADRKSAKVRRQARAKAAKRAESRAAEKADEATPTPEDQDKKAAAARRRTRARRAAASGETVELIEETTDDTPGETESIATTELTGRGVRTRRATQDTGSASGEAVGEGTRTLDDIAAIHHSGTAQKNAAAQHAGEGYRPAVYNYSKEPAQKKRSAVGPIAAGLLVAALAAGGGYYALNGNPFADDTSTSSSQATSSEPTKTSTTTSNSSSEADAQKDVVDFENDTFRVELPERWKDKLSFTESNGVVDIKDTESGTTVGRLLTGENTTPTDMGGQVYSLGEAKRTGAAIPVSLFVPDVDADGKPVEVGATGDKSALDKYLETTAKVFASYIKVKDGDDYTTAKFESSPTSNASADGSADNANNGSSGSADGSGDAADDASGSGTAGNGGSGDGTTWSGGAGSTIAPADGNTDTGSSSGASASAEPTPAPAPAPEPAPAADSGSSPFWCAQAGAFKSYGNAEAYANQLRNAGFSPEIVVSTDWTGFNQDSWYLVIVGRYGDKGTAQSTVNQILGSGFGQAFVQYSGDKK